MELYGKRIIIISSLILSLSLLDFFDNKIISLFNFKEDGYFEFFVDLVSPFIEIILIYWALWTGKEILRRIHERENQYQRLVQLSPEAIIVHRDGKILYINDSGVQLFGANSQNEIIFHNITEFVHDDSKQNIQHLKEQISLFPNRKHKEHVKVKRFDGTILDIEFTSTLVDFEGHPAREIIARDITILNRELENMKQIAFRDALTGLPNRRAFMDKLHEMTSDTTTTSFGLMFIDLDGFKQVNDQLGHDGGDILLQQVAEYLQKSVAPKDMVARLAGDEFMVLLPDAYLNECIFVANQMIKNFQSTNFIMGKNVVVTPSIGIALYPETSDKALELIKYADIAMYQAKQSGKNNYQIYQNQNEKNTKKVQFLLGK
ncbi:sensor domain-containing diguanylate cyclase [Bacillus timonensis]|uniref:sensor domain-containing diguanylate cyclase n=1 Tax=Bacillus timonensis TaxID=1033734 RepID=UPI00028904D8|nr:sensor domain-containing diguanylate cyclase [Bacillus timonensis]